MLRLILTSDTHYGFYPSKTALILNKFVKKLAKEKPDVVLHAGDWGSTKQKEVESCVKLFRRLLPETPIVGTVGNHDCLDEETECYTKRGWLRYQEIQNDDEVLGINPANGQSEWQSINDIIIKHYEGDMYFFKKETLDLLCTPNHRIFHQKRSISGNQSPYTYTWSEYKFNNISDLSGRIRIPVSGCHWQKEYDISDELIELAGLMVTDSHFRSYIVFFQRESNADFVRNILNKNGIIYKEKKKTPNVTSICGKILKKPPQVGIEFSLRAKQSRDIIEQTQVSSRKHLPPWIWELSDRQFDLFLNVVIEADGHREKEEECTAASVYKPLDFINQLQAVCSVHGYHANIRPHERLYKLILCKRLTYEMDIAKSSIPVMPYNGNVWCLTVKHGNFLIRRNGNSCYTGNCWAADKTGILLPDVIHNLKRIFDENNVITHFKHDNVEIFGYNSWYKTNRPPSNDYRCIPALTKEDAEDNNYDWLPSPRARNIHQHLLEKSYLNCQEVCEKLKASDAKHKVVVTHFEAIEYRGDPFYDGMKGSYVEYEMLMEAGATIICYGHSHRVSDFINEKGVRVLNCGSDYNEPKFTVIELC